MYRQYSIIVHSNTWYHERARPKLLLLYAQSRYGVNYEVIAAAHLPLALVP